MKLTLNPLTKSFQLRAAAICGFTLAAGIVACAPSRADNANTSAINALAARLNADEAAISALQSTVNTQSLTISSQAGQIASLQSALTSTNAQVTRQGAITSLFTLSSGIGNNTELTLTGVNLHIVNGLGATNGNPNDPASAANATVNGLGNLILGYDEMRSAAGSTAPSSGGWNRVKNIDDTDDGSAADASSSNSSLTGDPTDDVVDYDKRIGSHNLIIGSYNNYTGFGGIIVGFGNQADGAWSSVVGGKLNKAKARFSFVAGGKRNVAKGNGAEVVGGTHNVATGANSVVSGGDSNQATGDLSSDYGGESNDADSVGWNRVQNVSSATAPSS